MKKLYLLLLTIILTAAFFTGCAGKPGEPAYAGPMTDNLLTALEDNDYEAFSRDFSDTMKAEMTQDAFTEVTELLDSKIGDYRQKSFGEAAQTEQNGVKLNVVIYNAKYSNEPGNVIVTVYFDEEGKLIEGLFISSPKLAEQ